MSIGSYLAESWQRFIGVNAASPSEDEQPLRAELYSADQMAQYGEALARAHEIANTRGRDRLLPRLDANEQVLVDTCRLLADAIKSEQRITPAGEWLLDNFYLIDEQIRASRRNLPRRYSLQLPRLATGSAAGLPRVYDIALEAISHGDGRVSDESLSRFVAAYQRVTPLKLGELWAVPIMLRLALIENLRRVAARISIDRRHRNLAGTWADQMVDIANRDPKSLILVIADMARSEPPMVGAFVAELARRLQGQGHALALPLTWIEQRLAESGLTIEQLIQAENQQQAADQVSISNSIGSLRFLALMDWSEFVESLSVSERILRDDPAGIYASMDFTTRDCYRHVIEDTARRGLVAEDEVARKAIALTMASASSHGNTSRSAHVGFYLVDAGLRELERAAGVSPGLRHLQIDLRSRLLAYLGAIAALTLLATLLVFFLSQTLPMRISTRGILLLLSALASTQLALAFVNRVCILLLPPKPLPSLDFSEGIPSRCRTLVVVPTMLSDIDGADALVESIEVRYLANRNENIHFALLTDFNDAASEHLPGDDALLEYARLAIEHLNHQYKTGNEDVFFLMHRPRRWNAGERSWMGYERKRGKLGDLNNLLKNADRSGFQLIVGDTAVLSTTKYVITLDTDTQLPRDAAVRMIAAMAHPLNTPQYDEHDRRVMAGYGILQPRVAATLASANRSRYAKLHSGDAGIDPYTRAVSDVYQDAFAEGSFIGKGIYDVAAFEHVLKDRFPENRILSHDLLEGCYARSGLLSNVELYEDTPARYASDISRQHRWVRGDWQIAGWLFTKVPGENNSVHENPLTLLSQWKILDNLRRSWISAALTLLLISSWFVMPDAWLWTGLIMSVLLLPPLLGMLGELLRKPSGASIRQHLRSWLQSSQRRILGIAFQIACLPYEAASRLDAMLRTAVRMIFTRRHLLQWTPSSDVERRADTSLAATVRSMWVAPALAMGVLALLSFMHTTAIPAALCVLVFWFVSPLFAWWLSQPIAQRQGVALTASDTAFLRIVARKTWAFFEDLVTAEDNWLPPDNIQEMPVAAIAHRTSPTNIGMALLANLSAHDFGYIGSTTLIERTANTFATMLNLKRERGHFYNWYDTHTLQPLQPVYISSVDSGNLAAHLQTLRAGLATLCDQPVAGTQILSGALDVLVILEENPKSAMRLDLSREVAHSIAGLDPIHPPSATQLHAALQRFLAAAQDIASGSDDPETKRWAAILQNQCRDALNQLSLFASWVALPTPPRLQTVVKTLAVPNLGDIRRTGNLAIAALQALVSDDASQEEREWIDKFAHEIETGSVNARDSLARIERLLAEADDLAQMDFAFLYDTTRNLFSIGYNVTDRRHDVSYYDLLASEARLANFVAIAQGQVHQDSWYALGRLLTQTPSGAALLSWSGSMFEYLMPLLVMPTYENSLLDQSYVAAVNRQIAYGRECSVPWGVSESGYSAVDASLNYQYRAFGVPGLGLKRGLSEDLVIAPYATTLALMVEPKEACRNLRALETVKMLGRYGFYEALDFTPARQRRGESSTRIRSFMAHHQGMSLLAIAYVVLGRPMQKRFESIASYQATLHLLQERVPKATTPLAIDTQMVDVRAVSDIAEMPIRIFDTPDTSFPSVQLLSNGRYHVMLTNAGGGYSRWKDLAVTRWREDGTRDNTGMFCYLRDLGTGRVWSTAFQPTRARAENYEAIFTEPRVEFIRRDQQIDTHTDIAVSPEDDIELRRIRLINRSRLRKTIEITSYAEVVLMPQAADVMQRGFNNLFVQTEIVAGKEAIVCTRRPRSASEKPPWMLHVMKVRGEHDSEASYETDRMRFIGRGRTLENPAALGDSAALSGSEGSVLDPIVSIRQRIVLDPEQTVTIDIVTGVAEDRDVCLGLIDKYQDRHLADRVFDLAWTHSQVALRQINLTDADAQLYGRMASRVIYADSALRADASVIATNRRSQPGLWGYAISGDLPIVLLKIGNVENIGLARQLVQAHAYWRMKGLAVDLVIWNDDRGGYRQLLNDQIIGLIAAGIEANVIDRPGGIFVRPVEQISPEDRLLLQAVAHVIIADDRGSLLDQVKRRPPIETTMPRFAATRPERALVLHARKELAPALQLFNGIGGFSADGSEYVMRTSRDNETPLPWVNVLANPDFGTVVSDRGSAYTWAENAHEFRLTPWQDDPVCDPTGEAFYVRDEETGQFWSPTPSAAGGTTAYDVRHGFGYSVFEHEEHDIRTELWMYVALDEPVKFCVLKVRNIGVGSRRLSATGYVEWVLGDVRAKSAMHVVSEIDPNSGAMLARNAFNAEFTDRVALFDVDDSHRTISGDRDEFIGRNGSLRNPAAMRRAHLSGKVGAGVDPCAAIQVPFELAEGKSREIIFRLGAGTNAEYASDVILRCRQPGTARDKLDAVRQHWSRVLGAVRVSTPDVSLNLLANGWLLYQVIASRLWARSGYYQSGGAWGFRDQLQDTMALVHCEPAMLRAQLLLCASRQFEDGDVQHWWHPPSGRGVRTLCSDDYLWLPYAACRYIQSTGDIAILQEKVSSLDGRRLGDGEESYYDLPGKAPRSATFYEHCRRAVIHGLRFGERGLPLMGAGDWNDGMNNVGIHGKGESVWLAFFLFDVLNGFSAIAEQNNDPEFAARCRSEASRLRDNIETHAWDGGWYRRAYFDDGTPLGSSANDECQIDSLAQSWAVLSGAGSAERVAPAMQALDRRLVRRDHALIQLLDPPFDKSKMDPGYIKGYVPGVRENGGQYTHAAVWAAMAFAVVGDAERTHELFAMINPLNHASDTASMRVYKAEPYVVAADVYAVEPHIGRGGWTWYTGSAGWLYRLIVESMLGLRLEGNKLRVNACFPAAWNEVDVMYRHGNTRYQIEFRKIENIRSASLSVDGIDQDSLLIPLLDDGASHHVRINAPK